MVVPLSFLSGLTLIIPSIYFAKGEFVRSFGTFRTKAHDVPGLIIFPCRGKIKLHTLKLRML
jgi:hypothetical protein